MKKILLLIIVSILAIPFVQAQEGQKGVGLNFVYGTKVENMGLGGKLQYGLTNNLRGEAACNVIFDDDLVELNATLHYLITIGPQFKLYPLAGPTLVFCDGAHFGANFGGGLECDINSRWAVNFEGRYSTVNDHHGEGVVGVGFAYKF